jgi:hypothetical protein
MFRPRSTSHLSIGNFARLIQMRSDRTGISAEASIVVDCLVMNLPYFALVTRRGGVIADGAHEIDRFLVYFDNESAFHPISVRARRSKREKEADGKGEEDEKSDSGASAKVGKSLSISSVPHFPVNNSLALARRSHREGGAKPLKCVPNPSDGL